MVIWNMGPFQGLFATFGWSHTVSCIDLKMVQWNMQWILIFLNMLLHGSGTIIIFLRMIIFLSFLFSFLGGPAFSNNDDQTYDVMDLDLETMWGMWFGRGLFDLEMGQWSKERWLTNGHCLEALVQHPLGMKGERGDY